MTKKMDWWKAKQGSKRTASISDENDRRKGDRAARWLDKAELRDWEKLERDIEKAKRGRS